ncbi:putative transcription factor C2H2 family [Rosa chinensis]|uniref:RING-type E3 ubiquitin transferase n=1 Tax=Rosa chinensis TaxID=74649 RepID=A0A2P6S4J8_ROSCH|nr:putative transcription factor C2H2 family [Rosa chinensis]
MANGQPPVDIKKQASSEICNICWEELQEVNHVKEMPKCKHMFHVHCINAWLAKNACCPLCRRFAVVPDLISILVQEYEDDHDDDGPYVSIHDLLMEDDDETDDIIPILIPDHENGVDPIGLGNVDNAEDVLVGLVEEHIRDYIPILVTYHHDDGLDPMSLGNDDDFDMGLDQEEDAYIESLVFSSSDDDWYGQDDTETQNSQ